MGRWAPLWQQRILKTLAAGSPIAQSEISQLVEDLLAEQAKGKATPLDLAMPPSDDTQVTLLRLRECKAVNPLVDGQLLEFHPVGLNIIYGDNGSGKSGYARLIKDMVGARHPAEILADVFEESPMTPSAVLCYAEDGTEEEQKFPGPPSANVKKMAFYDEHCGTCT